MKTKIFSILAGVACAMTLTSCEDLFEPAKENFKDVDQMYDDSAYAQGFLVNVYRNIPSYYDDSDVATDDAVTNEKDNSFLRMATGSWAANNNPMSNWDRCYGSIQYINLFLENADNVHWADDPEAAALFCRRMKGEAYGMRALFMYYLLRAHAGIGTNGELLGVPVLTAFQTTGSDFNIPRETFDQCLNAIYADLDLAEEYLPLEYEDVATDGDIPARFQDITQRAAVYNRVMGQYARLLFNGLHARAIRARVALLAASPAFGARDWSTAADAAASVLEHINGISGLDPDGITYYTNNIDAIGDGINPREFIWRENVARDNSAQEEANFPPSLYGKGKINPSQNLVDAFPMANGYPITDSRGHYDASNPYAGRDPRLHTYIICNGDLAGVNNEAIMTGSDAAGDNALNKRETSTRTGYYLKKRLRMDVNCNPSSTQGKNHVTPRMRYTEMFLNYAEAANEAWGPRGNGGHGYSAYDVIKAIRQRAGVSGVLGDAYLDECAGDPDKMRALIRNERRLELCFESFRFWDLRRWKAPLNETVGGMDSRNGNEYTRIPSVESRSYADHMYYGPIPQSEILKFSNLIQNKDW